VDSQFKARQSIRQFADRVKISAQNAAAEGIIVRVVGPRSYKISERKMFRKIGNYDDREFNYFDTPRLERAGILGSTSRLAR
jgi:hypothetical protein